MAIVTLSNVAKSFGATDIFSGISAGLPHGARVALVGSNGVGKTTLLNLIVGLDTASAGSIYRAKGLRMGFLPQRPELDGKHSLYEEMLTAFGELRRMEVRLAELEKQMAESDDEALLDTYGNLQARYEHAGGFEYEHRIKMVLTGLSFTEEEYDRPLTKLSGGERTRALLGRLLLESPDLLVLDEPTNHLDINAVEWLEGFLKSFSGAVLVVSHDRYFMDRVVNTIWEMAFGTLAEYRGNYSHYTAQRVERHERLMKEYQAQQAFIQKEMDYIRRNMGRQRTSQAKGKLRRLETMILGKSKGDMNRLEQALSGDMSVASARADAAGMLNAPQSEHHMNMQLKAAIRSGDKVLMTYDLGVGYPDGDLLFNVPDITLYRREIAALIGPNGAGKTTFLKTVLGQLEPKLGSSRLGAGVQIGYFAQAHEELNPNNSIMDEILMVRHMPMSQARNYLARFLFQGDDVFRPINTLSGGERGRVALAKLALNGANFLLLDEPTNHLDIPSQEILEDVLADFEGTILMVSHDRYLIDSLATQVWIATPGEMVVFDGSYSEYVAVRDGKVDDSEAANGAAERADTRAVNKAKQTESPRHAQTNGKTAKKHKLSPYQRAQRTQILEALIEELEVKLVDLSGEIGEASAAGDAGRVHELGQDYARTESELEAAMEEWEDLLVD
jgi:ATP-binding cassette subfamily F protein 3